MENKQFTEGSLGSFIRTLLKRGTTVFGSDLHAGNQFERGIQMLEQSYDLRDVDIVLVGDLLPFTHDAEEEEILKYWNKVYFTRNNFFSAIKGEDLISKPKKVINKALKDLGLEPKIIKELERETRLHNDYVKDYKRSYFENRLEHVRYNLSSRNIYDTLINKIKEYVGEQRINPLIKTYGYDLFTFEQKLAFDYILLAVENIGGFENTKSRIKSLKTLQDLMEENRDSIIEIDTVLHSRKDNNLVVLMPRMFRSGYEEFIYSDFHHLPGYEGISRVFLAYHDNRFPELSKEGDPENPMDLTLIDTCVKMLHKKYPNAEHYEIVGRGHIDSEDYKIEVGEKHYVVPLGFDKDSAKCRYFILDGDDMRAVDYELR